MIEQIGSPSVDLMKLDVEGAEIQVLEGGTEFFRSRPPAVVMAELTFGDAPNAIELLQRFDAFGYQLFGIYNLMYPAKFGPLTWSDALLYHKDALTN